MCVDDSPYNLFVIEELLKQIDQNLIIDTALNGQIALEQIKNKIASNEQI